MSLCRITMVVLHEDIACSNCAGLFLTQRHEHHLNREDRGCIAIAQGSRLLLIQGRGEVHKKNRSSDPHPLTEQD